MKPSDDQRSGFKRASADGADELNPSGPPDRLLEPYREMANDFPHEAEAEEWSEALIGDTSEEE